MTEGKWIIDNSVVRLAVDDYQQIITPTSDEIYKAEFSGIAEIRGYSVSIPSDSLQNLKFSKIPLDLEIWVMDNNVKTGQIRGYSCYIIGRKSDKELLISDPLSVTPDHCIIDGIWYPFARGALNEIMKIFNEGNISETGKI